MQSARRNVMGIWAVHRLHIERHSGRLFATRRSRQDVYHSNFVAAKLALDDADGPQLIRRGITNLGQ